MKARQSSNLRSCYGPWSPSSNCPDARCECCTDQVCKLYKCTIYSKIKLSHPKQSCPIRIIREIPTTYVRMHIHVFMYNMAIYIVKYKLYIIVHRIYALPV